jgi:hypothetical protein
MIKHKFSHCSVRISGTSTTGIINKFSIASPANAHPTAAKINESVTAGPACSAAVYLLRNNPPMVSQLLILYRA